MLEEVARLEHLVSGLLVLSRLDAGEAQREWVDVDLGELAASTAEQMRLMAEDRGMQLDPRRLRPLTVRGDRGRLKQVIVNLLDNAIKFTPRGGSVTLRTEQRHGTGCLEVRDTGIGIPPQRPRRTCSTASIALMRRARARTARRRRRRPRTVDRALDLHRARRADRGREHPGRGSCFR